MRILRNELIQKDFADVLKDEMEKENSKTSKKPRQLLAAQETGVIKSQSVVNAEAMATETNWV